MYIGMFFVGVHWFASGKYNVYGLPDVSSEGESGSDVSSNVTESPSVVEMLLDAEPKVEGVPLVDSDNDDPFEEAVPPVVGPPVHIDAIPVVVPVVPPVVLDALPEPVLLAAPEFGLGVQKAEVNTNSKTKCVQCDLPIPKGDCRLAYHPYKSQCRYLHTACIVHIPAKFHAHSRATLRYQQSFAAGGDVLKIVAACDEALALI